MIAHEPTLSRVSRSSAQRSFWRVVPLPMIAAEVRPTLTPIAVTMPGHTRHSSIVGIIVIPPSPRGSLVSTGVPAFSRAICFSKRWRAMASMPNVLNILRRMSYGGVSPCSSSSTWGRTSSSMKRFTASRIIWCSSLHSNMTVPSLHRSTTAHAAAMAMVGQALVSAFD